MDTVPKPDSIDNPAPPSTATHSAWKAVGQGGGPSVPISFAAAVSRPRLQPRFPPIKLPARQIGSKDGKPAVAFSAMEIEAGAKRFKFSLVAKFQVGRPSLLDIQNTFKASWMIKGRATISEIWDGRHILIILDSEEDVSTALSSPVRKVNHSMFRLFRWTVDYNPRRESTITTAWIRLPGLPLPMYDRAFIEGIVSPFGRLVDVDERTKACLSLRFARACVELDVTKPIPEEVWISLPKGDGIWQKIEVESKVAYCTKCKIHGHTISTCKKNLPRPSLIVNVDPKEKATLDKAATTNEKVTPTNEKTTTSCPRKIGMNDPVKEQEWQVVNRKKKGKGKMEDVVQASKDQCVDVAAEGVDSRMEEAGAPAVMVSTVKSSVEDNRHDKGIDSHMEVVEEVQIRQANELAMVVYGAGLPEQVGKIVLEENFLVEENGEIPSNGSAETSDRNAENGDLASTEEMQSSALHLDDGTSEDCAAKYSKVPVTADKDKQVVRSQFLDDYIKWAKVNGEFEDFLDYCKEQGFTHTYGSSITIEDSKRVDEDRSTTHNSDDEVCNQNDDNIRKPIPAKNRHRKNKGTRSSTRSCPKKKDKNFVYP